MNSKLFTPQRIITAIAIIALLLLFRECFKSRGNAGRAPDQVNIRYDAAPTNLNPFLTVSGVDQYTCARIFCAFGDLNPKTLELEPVIVKELPKARTVTEGAHAGELAFDFEIIPEAVWDNGTPVTGHDWAFTMKLIFHPLLASKAFLSYFKDLSGLEIDPVNPKKFTVYFKQYYFMAIEALCQTPIMPAYNYDSSNRLGNKPIADFLDTAKVKLLVTDTAMIAFATEFRAPKFANDRNYITGCGPYKLETMNDQGVILVKKENYWGDKVQNPSMFLGAYPKKLVYKVVKDENVLENMLKNGELDIIGGVLSPAKFLEMKKNDSLLARYNFELLAPMSYSKWLLNLSKPILKDVKVRKALAHIVNYDHLINNIRSSLAIRTVGPIIPSKTYYAKDLTRYDFNPQKAKELLAEAGWTDSNGDGIADKNVDGKNIKLVVEILVPISVISQQYAESLTETARLAGIEIRSISTDISQIVEMSKAGDYESTIISTSLFPGFTELSQRYHSNNLAPAGDNRSRYINVQFDRILDSLRSTPDDAIRNGLYVEAQTILYDELPEIFLLAPNQLLITSKKFDGVITGNRPGYFENLFKLK